MQGPSDQAAQPVMVQTNAPPGETVSNLPLPYCGLPAQIGMPMRSATNVENHESGTNVHAVTAPRRLPPASILQRRDVLEANLPNGQNARSPIVLNPAGNRATSVRRDQHRPHVGERPGIPA